MKFYIKVRDDETVSLMTESGQILGCFSSIYEALQICEDEFLSSPSISSHEVRVHSHDLDTFEQEYAIAV